MRILIADDHPMVLQGIKSTLLQQGHEVFTESSIDGCESALINGLEVDVLLLDYHFPKGSIEQLLQNNTLFLPENIAILSGMTEVEEMLFLLQSTPVKAFIPKTIDLEHLDSIVSDLVNLPRSDNKVLYLWDLLNHQFKTAKELFAKNELLSAKERTVYFLLKKGYQDKQIAEQLNRSIHTIRVQIRAIKRKKGNVRQRV